MIICFGPDYKFELEFIHWEKNRMYPPNHTGETMIAMSDKHLRAIARAKIFTESGIVTTMQPNHIKEIERDIDCLNEVFSYVRQQINEPGLPMSPEKVGQGNNGEKKPVEVVVVGESYGHKDTTS